MIFFLNMFWQYGLPFGIAMGLLGAYDHGWERGLTVGAFAGFSYGLIMATVAYLKSLRYIKNRPLAPDEKLIEEGQASYLKKRGWIYLTSSRLFYVSDKLNITGDELSFPLSEIESAERGFTLGIVPNKLILNLKNGQREEFIVQTPKNWANRIKTISGLMLKAPRA